MKRLRTRPILVLTGAAALCAAALAVEISAGGADQSKRETLEHALMTSFVDAHDVAIAEHADERLVFLTGKNARDERDLGVALLVADADGDAQRVPSPIPRISDDYEIQTVTVGQRWCIAGVDPSGQFAGACSAAKASTTGRGWNRLPVPPGRGSASYHVAGVGDDLYATVMTRQAKVSFIRAFRLVGRRWQPVGTTLRGVGALTAASSLGGRLAVTVLKSTPPEIRVMTLDRRDAWEPVISGQARARIGHVGDSPLLGVPQRLGQITVMGLSQYRDGRASSPNRFGVASLTTGQFASAPNPTNAETMGQVVANGRDSVVAVWKHLSYDPGRKVVNGTVRAAVLTGDDPAGWSAALRSATIVTKGEWLFGRTIVATRQRGATYVVYPRLDASARRLGFGLARLGRD
jgi:hypothetical protein